MKKAGWFPFSARPFFLLFSLWLVPAIVFSSGDQYYEDGPEKIKLIASTSMNPASMSKVDFYPVPQDLKMRLVRQSGEKNGVLYTYKGIVEFLIGKPSDLKIYFESTPDLAVEIKPVRFHVGLEGEKKEFVIPVRKGPGKAPFGKTWIRLRVNYLPDYDAMIKKISCEREKYPALGLYTRLLREIRTLKVRKKIVNTGIYVFPKEDDALQRILDENSR